MRQSRRIPCSRARAGVSAAPPSSPVWQTRRMHGARGSPGVKSTEQELTRLTEWRAGLERAQQTASSSISSGRTLQHDLHNLNGAILKLTAVLEAQKSAGDNLCENVEHEQTRASITTSHDSLHRKLEGFESLFRSTMSRQESEFGQLRQDLCGWLAEHAAERQGRQGRLSQVENDLQKALKQISKCASMYDGIHTGDTIIEKLWVASTSKGGGACLRRIGTSSHA